MENWNFQRKVVKMFFFFFDMRTNYCNGDFFKTRINWNPIFNECYKEKYLIVFLSFRDKENRKVVKTEAVEISIEYNENLYGYKNVANSPTRCC